MGRATRSGDDHFDAAALGRGGVFEQEVGSAVGGNHLRLVGDTELVERFGRGAHCLPVGGRAHDDANQWFHHEILSNKARIERNSSRDAPSLLPESTRSLVALTMSACSALRSAPGRHWTSSSSAAGPSLSKRARQASMRLCFSASIAETRDSALSAASMGAGSMSRMSLPMYCRWRASPPRLVMRLASIIASSSVSGRLSAASSDSLSAISRVPRSWAEAASRLRMLLLGPRYSPFSSLPCIVQFCHAGSRRYPNPRAQEHRF